MPPPLAPLPAAGANAPVMQANPLPVPARATEEDDRGDEEVPVKWYWWMSELPMMAWVMGGGALGACAAKLIGRGFVVGENSLGYCPAVLLGAIAAGLGVYVLAATDTRQFGRTVFFAVACGLCGQTVLEKSVSTVQDAMGITHAVDDLKAEEAKVTEAVRNSGAAGIANAIDEARAGAIGLVEKSAVATRQSDTEGARKANAAVISLVEKVGSAAPKTVDASLSFIETIGRLAEKDKNVMVKNAVDATIQKILSSSDIVEKPEFEKRALEVAQVLNISTPNSVKFAEGQLGRIYLEIAPRTQISELAPWKLLFATTGFSVKSQGYVSDLQDTECRVLFYDSADQPAAAQLVAIIRGNITDETIREKVEAVQVKGISGARPGHFDVRLGPETLRRLYVAPKTPE